MQLPIILGGVGDDEIIHLGGHDTSRGCENTGKNTGAIAIERGDAALLSAGDDRPGARSRARDRFVENESARQIAFGVELPHAVCDGDASLIIAGDRIRPFKAREDPLRTSANVRKRVAQSATTIAFFMRRRVCAIVVK